MIARLLSWLGVEATTAWSVLVVAVGLGGYMHGYGYATKQAQASHNAYVVKQSQATADALAKHLRELRAEQERGDALSEQLLSTNAENAKLSNDLKKRVPRVSTVYIEKPGAAPVALPDRPFTVGWVRDYNAALGIRMPQAPAAAGPAARTAAGIQAAGALDGIDPADLARSTVSQADVLDNHIDNAAVCKKLAAQLNAILDLDEGKKP
ncbi:MAG: hypothetical protein ACN6PF_25870 [Achromobacter veterisilvae]